MKAMSLLRSLVAIALTATVGLALAVSNAHADTDTTPAPLTLGSTAPMLDTPMMGVNGKSITLAKAAGKKGLMVVFICNHCPWVKAWQGRIAEIGNAALKQGMGVVAVNANDPAAYPEDDFAHMVTRAKEVGYKFSYVVDATSDVARAFGASHTPEAFVFDAKGKLVYHGSVDDNAQEPASVKSRYLYDAVTAVASAKPVATGESKALGCGIKFRDKAAAAK
jgi:cytochrome oxidase Cu insertion factor (SCO1/SenC/PrrC family)